MLGFSLEADAAAQRLVGWLRSGCVEVRRLEDRFLHGKAFLVSDRSHGVVAGSSNFTRAGLAANLELNLGNYSPHTVKQVSEWFDELWGEAVEYDLAALFESRFEPHPPQLIYLRMLWERYGAELDAEAEADPTGASEIHLTSFQTDGLWRAKRILAERNGVLIADEVGLGKTFLAGELIREATMDRRQRVLVITPATLRDGPWRAFKDQHMLPMELISYEELMADHRLNPGHGTQVKLRAGINEYAMVVIDEAHNLRNPATQRADALRRLLAGSPPKQLVLLTATPVNNSLWDLYYQLGYFLRNDAAFADVGIPSMRDHFARAMSLNPGDLTPEHLLDVLDAVAVRRTRSFVKQYYPNDTVPIDGRDQIIAFPTPRVRRVSYDLDAMLPGFFDRIARALDPDATPGDPESLTLARYVPSMYRLGQSPDSYEIQLAGLLRSGMLKRFESSPHAFAETCNRMANSHDAFLALLELGRVATGDELADWMSADSDDVDSADKHADHHTGVHEDAADYDIARLQQDVAADRDLLRSFAETARTVVRREDPNLAELIEQLAQIAAEATESGMSGQDIRNRRKVLIFSYYADTVDWIYEHLARGPAYVFCARVGDHDRAVFRCVEFGGHSDPDSSGDKADPSTVVADTLSCLDHARPSEGFDTPRELDDDTYRRAFDAWDVSRADIVEKWNYLADKANLEPRIPPALARASEILRTHSPAELTQDQVDRAMDSLAAPYPERTVRTIRAAMSASDDPAKQAREIIRVIKALGLEPYVPPEPLPEITEEDVHAVCWLALTGNPSICRCNRQ